MRYIGLDLAQTTSHKALVIDEGGQVIAPVLSVKTSAISLELLFQHAREGAPTDEPLIVVMEPTGMAWFPIAVFCQRQGVKVYLVNSQQVADLRRFYRKHAKSDRIDARVLARLPIVNPEKLHALQLIGARQMACQRGCKELDRLTDLMVAIQNRLRAIDRFAWPGLEQVLSENIAPLTRWFRENWYDPGAVLAIGATGLLADWQEKGPKSAEMPESDEWATALGPACGRSSGLIWIGGSLPGLRLFAGGGQPRAGFAGHAGSGTSAAAAGDCPTTLSSTAPKPKS
jgi:transposase